LTQSQFNEHESIEYQLAITQAMAILLKVKLS
jgi:hypothetical protein